MKDRIQKAVRFTFHHKHFSCIILSHNVKRVVSQIINSEKKSKNFLSQPNSHFIWLEYWESGPCDVKSFRGDIYIQIVCALQPCIEVVLDNMKDIRR